MIEQPIKRNLRVWITGVTRGKKAGGLLQRVRTHVDDFESVRWRVKELKSHTRAAVALNAPQALNSVATTSMSSSATNRENMRKKPQYFRHCRLWNSSWFVPRRSSFEIRQAIDKSLIQKNASNATPESDMAPIIEQ
jgi:hypothetical protein